MTYQNKKILLIDCETEVKKLLKTRLECLKYRVTLASNGKEALLYFTSEQPDLIVTDLMLPGLDGYELCRKIRETSQVPIIILTALGTISDKMKGFKLGADDYITKPFSPKELEIRISSLIYRPIVQTQNPLTEMQKILRIGATEINFHKKLILKNGSPIKLTDIEHSLLELLIENKGKELSRLIILRNIWGYTPVRYSDVRIIDVHISRLRAKIEKDPNKPSLIKTARGIGYVFQNHNIEYK